MSEPAPAEKLLDKPEACAALGKSPRTIANYVASGELACRYIEGKAYFASADIERLKANLATPSVRAVAAPMVPELAVSQKCDTSALARIDPEGVRNVATAFESALRNALQPFAPRAPKPWLTLAEAVEYSGLPRAFLISAARAGTFRAINVGTGKNEFWRFNREGLAK